MARTKNTRIVNTPPFFTCFKPEISLTNTLNEVSLTIDEYESIRLNDYLSLNHEEASKLMGISRPTFTRLINSAHKKIADFIVNGKKLCIVNKNAKFMKNKIGCCDCKYIWEVEIGENPLICPICSSSNIKNALICLREKNNFGG